MSRRSITGLVFFAGLMAITSSVGASPRRGFGISAGPTVVVGTASAIISWTNTQPGDGEVNYGTDPGALSTGAGDATVNVLSHTVVLPGPGNPPLQPGVTYFFQIVSNNSVSQNVTGSDLLTFTTLPNGTVAAPVVTLVSPVDGTQVSQGPVTVTAQVDYHGSLQSLAALNGGVSVGSQQSWPVAPNPGLDQATAVANQQYQNSIANAQAVEDVMDAAAQADFANQVAAQQAMLASELDTLMAQLNAGQITSEQYTQQVQTDQMNYEAFFGFLNDQLAQEEQTAANIFDQSLRQADATLSASIAAAQLQFPPPPISARFTFSVPLVQGPNLLVIAATDSGGLGSASLTIVLYTPPSLLAITSPGDGFLTNRTSVQVTVAFTFFGPQAPDLSATLNGVTFSPAQAPAILGPGAQGGTQGQAGFTITGLQEGRNPIVVSAQDSGGTTVSTVTVILDSIPPLISIISPQSGDVIGTQSFTITFTISEPATLTLNGQNPMIVNPGTTSIPYVAPAEGLQTITLGATDAAGNTSQAQVSFTVSFGAPLVQILAPPLVGASGVVNGTVPVSVTVNSVSASTVTISPGGFTAGLPPGGGTFFVSLPVQEGVNLIHAQAVNQYGLPGSADAMILVATLPPQATWVFPTAGQRVAGFVQIEFTVSDPNGLGVGQVVLTPSLPFTLSPDGTTGTGVLDSRRLRDGPETLLLQVTDPAGNQSSAAVQIIVDNTPPTIQITNPAGGTTVMGGIHVTGSAQDDSGVAEVVVRANGLVVLDYSPSSPMTLVPFDAFVNTAAFPDGGLELDVTARDTLGNGRGVATVVTVLNAAPPAVFVTPIDGSTISGTIIVQASVPSPLPMTVEFFADGISLGKVGPPYSVSFNTLGVLDGTLVLDAVVTDAAGGQSKSTIHVAVNNMSFTIVPTTIKVDRKNPPDSITAVISGQNVAILIPVQTTILRLHLPDGSYVTSGPNTPNSTRVLDNNSSGTPELKVKFDAAAVNAGLLNAINQGLNPALPVPIGLEVGTNGKLLGTTLVNVTVKK